MSTNLYINREMQASVINLHIFIDNKKIGEIANGKTEMFLIPNGLHEIFVKMWNGKSSPVLKINCQNDTTIFLRCGFSTWGKILLKDEIPPIFANLQGQSLLNSIQRKSNLEAQINQGLSWFYLISALSIGNSFVYLLGIPLTFVIGLGVTQIVDGVLSGLARDLSEDSQIFIYLTGLTINLLVAGLFMVAGMLGRKKHMWAVILGIFFYALDSIIFLILGGWIAVGFHILGLWNLWHGLQALIKMREFENTLRNETED